MCCVKKPFTHASPRQPRPSYWLTIDNTTLSSKMAPRQPNSSPSMRGRRCALHCTVGGGGSPDPHPPSQVALFEKLATKYGDPVPVSAVLRPVSSPSLHGRHTPSMEGTLLPFEMARGCQTLGQVSAPLPLPPNTVSQARPIPLSLSPVLPSALLPHPCLIPGPSQCLTL
jgi:hypothetical protein